VVSKYKKYMPYIRKMNGKEKADDLRTCFRLAHFSVIDKQAYVMVQHGFPNQAIAVGRSKEEIKNSIIVVAIGKMTFKEWARSIRNESNKYKK